MAFTKGYAPEHCPETCPTSTRIEWLIRHYTTLNQNLTLFTHDRLSPIEQDHNAKMLNLVNGFLDHLWEVYRFGEDCTQIMHVRKEG